MEISYIRPIVCRALFILNYSSLIKFQFAYTFTIFSSFVVASNKSLTDNSPNIYLSIVIEQQIIKAS